MRARGYSAARVDAPAVVVSKELSPARRLIPVVLCPLLAAVAAYTYVSTLSRTHRARGEIAIKLTHAGVKHGYTSAKLASSWTGGIPEITTFWEQAAYRHSHGAATQEQLRRGVEFANYGTNVVYITGRAFTRKRATLYAGAALAEFLAAVRGWPGRPATARVVAPVKSAGVSHLPVASDTIAAAVLGLMIGLVWFVLTPAGLQTQRARS